MLDILSKFENVSQIVAALEPSLEGEINKLSPHQQKIGKGLFLLLKTLSKQQVVRDEVPQLQTKVVMCPKCGQVHTFE